MVMCGLHDDGLRVVEQLERAGVPVLVVDDHPDPRLVQPLADLGVDLVRGDPQEAGVLAAAGVAGALAVICAESNDLRTLAIALMARESRADLRVVVQLRNAAVGRALSDVGVTVLDSAELAAPSTVEACLQTQVHPFSVDDQEFLVVRTGVTASAPLRRLFGDLAPLAVVPADPQRTVLVSPSRDTEVVPGDGVVLVGPADVVRETGLLATPGRREPEFVGARAPRPDRKRPTNLLLHLVRSLDHRVRLAILALMTLATVSVTVLRLGYQEADGTRMSVLDAVYFTVETVGTVGFGDFYFRDQAPWLRGWAIFLMIVGATLATVFFALLTNLLISRTIAASLGRRRVTGLSGHVVVVGAGSVGLAVVRALRAQHTDVVVVESDEQNRFLSQLREQRVPVVVADATLPDTWSAVGIDGASAVAIMTSDDLANIETSLAVRDRLGERWDRVPVVLRLFDRHLERTVSESFGFRNVRSPSALAAPWFVGAALGMDVLQTLYVGGTPMLVARWQVGPDLDGTPMRSLPTDVRVVALTRAAGDVVNLPRRDTTLREGDLATLVGPYAELLGLLRGHARP